MENKHFDFIDALRGYAIFAVMAVHASQTATEWTGVGRRIVDQGARGVQLFFVASALTLIMSWIARHDGTLNFYARRLCRIAPMFWLGILFFIWIDGFGPRYFAPNGIEGIDVVLTSLFLNGFHPESINSVVPGGWSIAVEMSFYLIFPLLAFAIRSWVSALFAFILANAWANNMLQMIWLKRADYWPGISDDLVSTFLNLWFPSQLPIFMVGFVAFFAIRDGKGRLPIWGIRLLLAGSLASMVVLALDPTPINLPGITLGLHTAYGLCFGVFAFCLAEGAFKWMVNPPLRYLGKVSFSAYTSNTKK